MTGAPSNVALIPARAGSQRVEGKNVKRLAGHPLLAYAIHAARASGVFVDVVVSTDSEEYAAVARDYGASVPFLRPAQYATATSPDIEWVTQALNELAARGTHPDCFSILRPTSPLRTAATLQRAWARFLAQPGVDSLRAVERCAQHPGKMWVVRGERMLPLLPLTPAHQPWHSSQYQALPEVYVQNASLEIAWTRVVRETGTIAGHAVMPFFTEGHEGLDINSPKDWWYLEYLIASGEAILPVLPHAPRASGATS